MGDKEKMEDKDFSQYKIKSSIDDLMERFDYDSTSVGQSKYVVEGTVLVDPQLVSAEPRDRYIIAKLDNDGEVIEHRTVTSDEFLDIKKKLIY